MSVTWDFFLTAVVTLFVVVDPPGVTPIFSALTSGHGWRHRLSMATKGILLSTVILILFIFGGEAILQTFGIGMPAFSTAGGILLLLLGLEMVFEQRTRRRTQSAAQSMAGQDEMHLHQDEPEDISIFPLAIPLLAGPGAMASVVLLTSTEGAGLEVQFTVLAALLVVQVIAFFFLNFASLLLEWAGPGATIVLTRIMGVLLAALSVQFIFNGIKAGLLE